MSSIQPPIEYPEDQTNQREFIPRLYVAIGIIVALVLAVLFILAIVWLARTQAATVEALRDVMIIALALVSCIFGITLMLLFVMVVRLLNMLEFEIKPILEKTNETLGTVRGTTSFVSQNVVQPVTKASSYVAGFRRGVVVLFGDPRKNLPD
jgi:uncharacterized protein YacL